MPSWRFILGSVLAVGLLGVGLLITAYLMVDVPAPEDIATAEATTVYYADGETEMGSFAEVKRQIIDVATLPDHVGNAIVASEDRRFYRNVGVDPVGIVRAFINNLRGGPLQGGSTITQQYVERYYIGETDGYIAKAKEAVLALKIDQEQSKEEILGNYMNTIYFGRGANGIEQAAIEYFDKPAADLTVSEAAMIAGIIPAPSVWDPEVSPDRAEQRWSRTLDLMVTSEFLSQAERDEQQLPDAKPVAKIDSFAGPQGYLLKLAEKELLEEVGLSETDINTGGYQIITTIDSELQTAAVEAAESLPDDRSPNLRVGLVSLDNETGAIKALYGGEDYLSNPYSAATQAQGMGGSTFKAFTLVAALEEGIGLGQKFSSATPLVIGSGKPINNYDFRDRGEVNLVTATQLSINTAYARLNVEIGPQKTMDMAIRLGLPEDTPGLMSNVTNTLGSASPAVIDNADAFSTIANSGRRTTPHIIEAVQGADGSTRYTGPTESESVIDPQVAADATYAMTQVVEAGTGKAASEIGRPAAGKTGSSQEYRSSWFVGYVPQVTTAVMLYQSGPDGEEEQITPFGGVDPVEGGSWPTTVWTRYMIEAVKDLPVEQFPTHSQVVAPQPTYTPTEEPTEEPSEEPSEEEPSDEETEEPSPSPSREPEPTPTEKPEPEPEPEPEPTPSEEPTTEPPPGDG